MEKPELKKEFIKTLQGKDFVLYTGLVDLAHGMGLVSIETDIIQLPNAENGEMAVVKAVVRTKDRVFEGIGDCDNANANRMIAPHKIRMAECVPTRAKILTKEGWKHYSELIIGEEVLAYDIEQDMNKWTKLQHISVFNGIPTVSMQTKSFYSECTQDHKWVVQNNNKTELRELNDMKVADKVVTSAYTESGGHPLTPFEAAILGWLITDGSIRKTSVNGKEYLRFTIYQSKPEYVEELKKMTKEIGSYSVERNKVRDFGDYKSDCLDAYKFNIKASYGRYLLAKAGIQTYDDLIPLINNLSNNARESMLDAMLKADGTKKRGGEGNWEFGTKKENEKIMRAFEILCTLEGVTLGRPRISTVGEVPIRVLKSYKRTGYQYMKIEEIEKQDVWCPTTKYGTWIMNLDGYITITGNTRAKARALRDLTNVGLTALEELSEEEEGPRKYKPNTGSKAVVTEKQLARLFAIAGSKGIDAKAVRERIKAQLKKEAEDLTRVEYDVVCKAYEELKGGN